MLAGCAAAPGGNGGEGLQKVKEFQLWQDGIFVHGATAEHQLVWQTGRGHHVYTISHHIRTVCIPPIQRTRERLTLALEAVGLTPELAAGWDVRWAAGWEVGWAAAAGAGPTPAGAAPSRESQRWSSTKVGGWRCPCCASTPGPQRGRPRAAQWQHSSPQAPRRCLRMRDREGTLCKRCGAPHTGATLGINSTATCCCQWPSHGA